MSNVNFICELTIVIPQLPCLFHMVNSVASAFELVGFVASDSVNLFNSAMGASARKCFPIELVSRSNGQQRTLQQTIHLIPLLLVWPILQCRLNCNKEAYQDLYELIRHFKSTFDEAHQVSNMIGKVLSLKLWIKMHSFLEDIITSRKVFEILHQTFW
jgi:hypothetical protein